jgi:hypothetical protein
MLPMVRPQLPLAAYQCTVPVHREPPRIDRRDEAAGESDGGGGIGARDVELEILPISGDYSFYKISVTYYRAGECRVLGYLLAAADLCS